MRLMDISPSSPTSL
uniref:Uncharacterized protein n=1 Tax=Arundo donax TaxID=35708 RepID=A0A0A8Y9T0_ARUDO